VTFRKIGLLVIRDGRLLLCKKRGLDALILPGGKPKLGETPFDCLEREVWEELGAAVKGSGFFGWFESEAAGQDARVELEVYLGDLTETLSPRGEIESVVWYAAGDPQPLAPSLEQQIVPELIRRGLIGFRES
jgi:8-oxo-dGTP diphosphatase